MDLWLKSNGFGKNEFKKEAQEIIYLLNIILFKDKSNLEYIKTSTENLNDKYPKFLSFLLNMKIFGLNISGTFYLLYNKIFK